MIMYADSSYASCLSDIFFFTDHLHVRTETADNAIKSFDWNISEVEI